MRDGLIERDTRFHISRRQEEEPHGGHFARFLENNGNYNARLASACGLTANKSSGLIVL